VVKLLNQISDCEYHLTFNTPKDATCRVVDTHNALSGEKAMFIANEDLTISHPHLYLKDHCVFLQVFKLYRLSHVVNISVQTVGQWNSFTKDKQTGHVHVQQVFDYNTSD